MNTAASDDWEAQESPGTRLNPLPASLLAELEIGRRDGLMAKRVCGTGCSELDHHILMSGGFERGCVVGISSEKEEFRLIVSERITLKMVTSC
jgi:hypothetical protein